LKIETVPSGLINGTVTFGFKNGNSLTMLPLSAEPMRDVIIPHIAQNNSFFTGVAFLNPGPDSATVNLKVFGGDGAGLAFATVVLPAGKRLCKLVQELWPALNNQVGGHITASSDHDVIISSIFGTNTLTVLSAIPAQVLDK
jgi:hypothetical protein